MQIRSKKFLGGTLLSAVLLLGGAVHVAASDTGQDNRSDDTPATPAAATPAAAQDVGATEVYSGIAPCRILDTRSTSPITGTTRNFDVSGALSAQGGSDSCGIPTTATSVIVNLTGISVGGSTGFVRGWAAGDPPVNATLLNYSPALNATNQVTIPLCTGTCSDAFTLQVFGSANIVGDAVGYTQAPMFAYVLGNGSIESNVSSGVVSVTRNSAGNYTVLFDRPVTDCDAQASGTAWATDWDVSPDQVYGGGPNDVIVQVLNDAGSPADGQFNILVTC